MNQRTPSAAGLREKQEIQQNDIHIPKCGRNNDSARHFLELTQQLILDSIVSREMDPQALPRHPGKRGIKAAIKQTLRQEHKNIFRSDYAFDAAWKALRKNGVIKDA